MNLYTGGTGIILYDAIAGKVLLGKRTDNQGWGLPGGKREEGETPKECAIRELYEEFGVVVNPDDVEHCGYVFSKVPIKGVETNVISNVFKCYVNMDKIIINLQEAEMSEYLWAAFDDIVNLEKIYPPTLVCLNKYTFLLGEYMGMNYDTYK